MKPLFASLFFLSLLPATTSQAAIIINTAQVGGDVVFSFAGTFDVTYLTSTGVNNYNELVSPFGGGILFSGTGPLDGYKLQNKFPSFGAGSNVIGTATGDAFKMYTNNPTFLGFASGYSGEFISGNLTIANANFQTLGILTGQYTVTAGGGDYVQLNIPALVPIPAALPLLLSALGVFGIFGWRRKRLAAACQHTITDTVSAGVSSGSARFALLDGSRSNFID